MIHLALSPKAALYLDVFLEHSYQTRDGAPIEIVDFANVENPDRDEARDIFEAIREDIKDGLAMQGQKTQKRERPTGPGRRVKKGAKKK